MYRVRFSKTSRKSLKKLRHSGSFEETATAFVLNELSAGKILEARYQNHKLHGEYAGCFECHIKDNLLLIYEIDEKAETLTVIDIGTHTELFE